MSIIRKKIGSGIFYTALAKYSNIFVSIIIGAVLARLLSPAEFGIVAIVTVFVSFFALLSDFGIGPAIVQNQYLNEGDIRSVFSFSIIIGILMAAFFFLAGPIIANFYGELALVNVSRLLSVAILFYSLQIVPNALSQKKFQFKQIGLISVIVQLCTGIVAIILAYYGFSYYSLIFKSILDSLLTFILFYRLSPVKVTFHIRMASVKKIARFSIFQFMFNFINYFSRNADNLLIGKYFSPSALGYYDKSYRLMMLPVANLTHVITPVLMPILSTYQNDKDVIYNAYIKVVKLLAIIGFPLSAFLFFTAPEIVNILYGPNWVQCIPVFRLLAITIGIQMVLSSTGSIFQAMNRTDLLFFSGSLNTVFMISGIIYGVFIEKSVESVAFGLIIAFIINFFLGFYILVKVVLDKPFFNFLDIFLLPIAISIPIVIINYLINSFCHSNIYIESLFFKFICTIILYFIMLGSMPKFRSEVLNLLKNKKK